MQNQNRLTDIEHKSVVTEVKEKKGKDNLWVWD